MKKQTIKTSLLRGNPTNPRTIREEKFLSLVKSIKAFPEMLDLRPLVVDEDNIVLGGNMRLRACVEAGLDEVPCVVVSGWTEERKKEFIIKDNVGFGEWDWDVLANEWDEQDLLDWGMSVWNPEEVNLDDFFETREGEDPTTSIQLTYEESIGDRVKEALEARDRTREQIIATLLGIE